MMAKRTTKSEGGGGGGGIDASVRLAIFHGDELYLQSAYTEQLRAALQGELGEIELVRFDGKSAGVGEVLDECRSFGLMTAHKLVIVDEGKEWLSEADEEDEEGGGATARRGEDDDDDEGPIAEADDAADGGSDGDAAAGGEDDAAGGVEEDTATMALFGGGGDEGGGAKGAGGSAKGAGKGEGKGTAKPARAPVPAVRRVLRKRELVERYAESPADSATLVIRGKGFIPGRLGKVFEARGVVIKCESPNAASAAAAARRRMREQHGRVLSPEAAEVLVERVGSMLGRLVHEVDKLALAVDPGREITVEDVTAMVGLTREQQNWEIKKALLAGDPARTIGLIHELLTVSRTPMQLIRWNFLDLAKSLYALGESAAGKGGVSARGLRLWGEEERRAMGIVRSASLARLRSLLDATVEADYRAKTGQGNEIRALEVLAVEFASLGR